jgi:hypothetical protein
MRTTATVDETPTARSWHPDVDQLQPAAGPQNTNNLCHRFGFHILVQMVQHHRGQRPVDVAVPVWQPLSVAALEPNSGQSTAFAASG